MRLSHTQLQTYLTCPRMYLHHYLRKMRMRKRPTYFVLGGAVHKFIDSYYTTRNEALALAAVNAEFAKVDRSLLNADETHALECDRMIALGICEAYPKFYNQDFDQYKQFLCERMVTIRLGEHDYQCFLDCLMQDAAGDWWIKETKTASAQSLTADYFERVQIDSQVSGYMHAAKDILGVFPRGVVYDVIKKPSIRLKKGETHQAFQKRIFQEYITYAQEKAYFTRQELLIGNVQLKRWLANTEYVANQLAALVKAKTKIWPMNTGACTGKFGACQWLNACITNSYNSLLYQKEV